MSEYMLVKTISGYILVKSTGEYLFVKIMEFITGSMHHYHIQCQLWLNINSIHFDMFLAVSFMLGKKRSRKGSF